MVRHEGGQCASGTVYAAFTEQDEEIPAGEVGIMAKKKKYSTSQKAFYILSLLIVASMVIGLFAVALNPG